MNTFKNATSYKEANNISTCDFPASKVLYLIVYCIIVVVGIIGNSLVLFIFRPYVKRHRHGYEVLIWYLSLFDLTTLVIAIHEVYEDITCHKSWPFGAFACKLLYPCYYISINISIFTLLIIALDRYRCIVMPFKKKFSHKTLHMAVFLSVLMSLAMQWYHFKALYVANSKQSDAKHCVQNREIMMYTIPRAVTLLFRDTMFIFVFSVTTSIIHCALGKKSLVYCQQQNKKRQNQKVFNMLLIMGGTFVLLVLPYDLWDCAMLISRMLPESYKINLTSTLDHIDAALSILQTCNSAVNCIIYAKMHRYFKASILKCCIRKSTLKEYQAKYGKKSSIISESETQLCNKQLTSNL